MKNMGTESSVGMQNPDKITTTSHFQNVLIEKN